jgi:large subunit ribosomal protein L10
MPTHTHARQTANPVKATTVEEITEHFANSSAAVITEYRGLSVKQLSTLRRALGRDTTYAVLKNTLAKRAAENAGVPIDESLLTGPTAIAFVGGDPVEAAKGLKQFAKDNPLLVIKGGVLDGKALSAADVSKIADLESREVLLAKVAGAIKALPARAAALFQAPLINAALLVKALEEKGGAAPQAAAPAAEAAPAEVVAESEAPAAEATATEEAAAEAADTTEAANAADEAPAEPAE